MQRNNASKNHFAKPNLEVILVGICDGNIGNSWWVRISDEDSPKMNNITKKIEKV